MSVAILHIDLRDKSLLPRSGAGRDPGEEGMVAGFAGMTERWSDSSPKYSLHMYF